MRKAYGRALCAAKPVADMDIPSFPLHRLTGEYNAFWPVTVRARCCLIVFQVEDATAFDVDLVGCH
ncbi:MAG TPA: hypothetical protein VKE72_05070 [Methylocella sp.]|nr:hypothetical protein [Methylocella sp.]